MKADISSRQIDLLLQRPVQRLLEEIMRTPCSAKELTEKLNLGMNEVHYRLSQMQEAGLIEVAEVQPRKGRPIKRYQSSQSEFRLPFSASAASSYEEHILNQMGPLMAAFVGQLVRVMRGYPMEWGVYVRLNEDRNLVVSLGYTTDAQLPPTDQTIAVWSQLELSPQERSQLVQDLRALMQKHQKNQPSLERKQHILGMFFSEGEIL